jgi:hypothetical protein
MVWAVLALLGVPLWLCALGILAVLFRNSSLRKRHGDIPVRVLRAGKTRWTRGHAVWVSDVFAWRGSPAAWREDLLHVVETRVGTCTPEESKRLRRLGQNPVVATLVPDDGDPVRVAVAADHRVSLLGPSGSQVGTADRP